MEPDLPRRFPLAFVAAYLVFATLMRLAGWSAGGSRLPLGLSAGSFVLSLVPIAIADHLAHYFLFLLQDRPADHPARL